MRVKCLHGYFIFEETRVGQISDFMSLTGLSLVPKGDQFTFEKLANAPEYSLVGKTLIDIPAVATFEGKPWEVFEANGFVYDFVQDLIVPIASVIQTTKISRAGNRFISPGLVLPGSLTDGGRVKDYAAWFSRDRSPLSWLYSEVGYV